MKKIKYETNCSTCLTACPHLRNVMICSNHCTTYCIFYSHHTSNPNILFCRFDELSQRKEEEEITEVKKYEKIPDVVEAIQFTSTCPFNTLRNFLQNVQFKVTINLLEIQYRENRVDKIIEHSKYANWGDWIVKENGDYNILTDEEFKKRYKEI
jgi:hypothetical protein